MKNKTFKLILLFLVIISCTNDKNQIEKRSSEKELISFTIKGIKTEVLETEKIINVHVGTLLDNYWFKPDIKVSEGAEIEPKSGAILDYSKEIEYTITAQDGTSTIFKVNLVEQSGLKKIELILTRIGYKNKIFTGVVNKDENKIYIDYSGTSDTWYYKDHKHNLNIGLVGENIKSVPASGSEINPWGLKTLSIINGKDTTVYEVEFRSIDKDLICFKLPIFTPSTCNIHFASWRDDKYTQGLDGKDYVFYTLDSDEIDLKSLKPTEISVSERAKIFPDVSTPQNFNNDITYKITSESGDETEFKLRVVKLKIIITSGYSKYSIFEKGGLDLGRFEYFSESEVVKVSLVNIDTKYEIPCKIIGSGYNEQLSEKSYVSYTYTEKPKGSYHIKVVLKDGTEELTPAGRVYN